jgi:hypothetical protein
MVVASSSGGLVHSEHGNCGIVGLLPSQFRVSLNNAQESFIQDLEHPAHLTDRHALYKLEHECFEQLGEVVRFSFPEKLYMTVPAVAEVQSGIPYVKKALELEEVEITPHFVDRFIAFEPAIDTQLLVLEEVLSEPVSKSIHMSNLPFSGSKSILSIYQGC